MVNGYDKTRLYTPIRSKTTALPWCARHHSAQRGRSSPLRRGDESTGKRSHINRSSSPERVRLLQPLLSRLQNLRWPATFSRSQTPESRPGKKHFYAMHECGSLPSVTDGISHPQLPRWLAHSGPVRGSFNIAQDPPTQPLMLPGVHGQLFQEHTVTQSTSIIPGHSYGFSSDDRNCLSGVSHDDSAPHGFLQGRDRLSAQSFPENGGPYGSSFAITSVGSALHATHPVLSEAEGSTLGVMDSAQKEGCHYRRFQQVLESAVRR